MSASQTKTLQAQISPLKLVYKDTFLSLPFFTSCRKQFSVNFIHIFSESSGTDPILQGCSIKQESGLVHETEEKYGAGKYL